MSAVAQAKSVEFNDIMVGDQVVDVDEGFGGVRGTVTKVGDVDGTVAVRWDDGQFAGELWFADELAVVN